MKVYFTVVVFLLLAGSVWAVPAGPDIGVSVPEPTSMLLLALGLAGLAGVWKKFKK